MTPRELTSLERQTIDVIIARAARHIREQNLPTSILSIRHALTTTHTEILPLRLIDLACADDMNFCHDVFGIDRTFDADAKILHNCFLPRFSAPTPK